MKIQIGRVEWTFGALLLAYIGLSFVPSTPELLLLFLKTAASAFGAWVFIRLTRRMVREMLWRLRNRLIVAYIFIALVPVVLITLLVGLGAYLVGGQVTIYVVNSELERRTASLRGTIEFLARDDPSQRVDWAKNVAPVLERMNPGIELFVQDHATWSYPARTYLPNLPANWTPGNGLVLRKGVLYAWSYAVDGTRRVTALVPVTRDFLGLLAPDICESTILDLSSGHNLVHPALPGNAGPSHNRFPPAVNNFDFEIRWGAPIPVHMWDNTATVENEWLTIRTRPSAVLRTIFAQKVDWASGIVPLLFFSVAILFLTAEIIAMMIGVSLTQTITGAIHDLYGGTLRVRGSDFSHRIPIHGKDQLAELATSFNEMTANMERLLVIEKERQRLQAELEIAREVQNQLYPRNVPEMQSLCLTATCNPARMVSGDYYDYQQVDSNQVAIAIGDVAGKGISAALLMATIQSSFRSQLRSSKAGLSVSTSALVDHLNQQLYADTAPEKYATFYLGVYDDGASTLTYTNAGHLPPILVRNGTAERLEVNGMVVGAFPFAQYGESQIRLQSGDLVCFFTDGISEPENPYGEMFSEERIIDLLIRNAHLDDAAIIRSIMESVREWTGSDELQDDMTLLLVRRR
ncbi:MAG: SpoIIE family protein phosphatase [Bryobacteraceae bacterium]|nr:SpoIIE family protein phosphatase [Bryobacteraceae bacterium]